jgi:hypothetical protein
MNHAQKYLAQANWHIAELTVQIVRQRVIVKHARLPLASAQRWRSRCLMRSRKPSHIREAPDIFAQLRRQTVRVRGSKRPDQPNGRLFCPKKASSNEMNPHRTWSDQRAIAET